MNIENIRMTFTEVGTLATWSLDWSGVEGALAAGPEALERLELVVRPRITEIIASRA